MCDVQAKGDEGDEGDDSAEPAAVEPAAAEPAAADDVDFAEPAAAEPEPAANEGDESQYNEVCEADGCECVLGIDIGIYCLAKDGEEKTVCADCGQAMMGQGWLDTEITVSV